MTFNYEAIEKSDLLPKIKKGLMQDLKYIEEHSPNGLIGVYLFGSVARQEYNQRSDIDLCVVFSDDVDLFSFEMRVFRGALTDASDNINTDVVTLTEKQLKSNSQKLYQEINRDKISLIK